VLFNIGHRSRAVPCVLACFEVECPVLGWEFVSFRLPEPSCELIAAAHLRQIQSSLLPIQQPRTVHQNDLSDSSFHISNCDRNFRSNFTDMTAFSIRAFIRPDTSSLFAVLALQSLDFRLAEQCDLFGGETLKGFLVPSSCCRSTVQRSFGTTKALGFEDRATR
jgi:hypothetical protein